MSVLRTVHQINKELFDIFKHDSRKMQTSDEVIEFIDRLYNLPITLSIIEETRIHLIVGVISKNGYFQEARAAKKLIRAWTPLWPDFHRHSSKKSRLDEEDKVLTSTPENDSPVCERTVRRDLVRRQLDFDIAEEPEDVEIIDLVSDSESDVKPESRELSSPPPSQASHNKEVTKNKESLNQKRSLPMFKQVSKYQLIEKDARLTPSTKSVRYKSLDLLLDALKSGENKDIRNNCVRIAAEIEACVFAEFKNTNIKYKNRIRSRIINLNDKKNPKLRNDVLNGVISPETFAAMSPEEMASQELKEAREKIIKACLTDSIINSVGGDVSPSGLVKCPACLSVKCTYNQLQTLRADEPMTTFCVCFDCGKRWRFE